jgi:aryl-alcohol dehydrogenase-like predicted oxidoreductase
MARAGAARTGGDGDAGAKAMRYRTFGRAGWRVSEVGYGMWGLAGWTGSDDEQTPRSLQLAVNRGCNFFDTAWAYGDGRSERMLGELVRANPGKKLYVATKVPPKNRRWPSRRGDRIAEVFPAAYIREYAEKSLANLGLPAVDLLQFHVWEDEWAGDEGWQRAMDDLRRQGLIYAVGVSINRWEPADALRTLRTGRIDAVQVIYNIFDQNPEDELLPACRELNVAVIARVPFDEGSLTGALTRDSRWPEGDWRNTYFVPENLIPTLQRVEALQAVVPPGMSLPEMALRFILSNPDVSTVIPGMRKPENVRANVAASDAGPLPGDLLAQLRAHRWDRTPAPWSQ